MAPVTRAAAELDAKESIDFHVSTVSIEFVSGWAMTDAARLVIIANGHFGSFAIFTRRASSAALGWSETNDPVGTAPTGV